MSNLLTISQISLKTFRFDQPLIFAEAPKSAEKKANQIK